MSGRIGSALQNLYHLSVRAEEITKTYSRKMGMVRRDRHWSREELHSFALYFLLCFFNIVHLEADRLPATIVCLCGRRNRLPWGRHILEGLNHRVVIRQFKERCQDLCVGKANAARKLCVFDGCLQGYF